jgi:hypothetical protein
MTWTNTNAPSNADAAGRRDAVRFFVGDTDTDDQQATDEAIAFALSQTSDNIYGAAAIVARAIAGSYARKVSISADGLSQQFAQRQKHYADIAASMEKMAREGVAGAAPIAFAGGTAVGLNADAPEVLFFVGMHDRPEGDTAITTDDFE